MKKPIFLREDRLVHYEIYEKMMEWTKATVKVNLPEEEMRRNFRMNVINIYQYIRKRKI